MSLKQNSALEDLYKESGRGRHSKCWGSIFVALKYAMYVNKEIEIEVLKTFIESRILDYRLFGVEQFKNLNIQLDTKLNAKIEDYKAVSVAINIKCNGEYIEGWNHAEANPDIQKLRNNILDKTAFAVEMELIKTVEQLINVINNYNI